MSRIRTIKPDFWTSAQIIECSPNARLLFIGLWNFCDDMGRHPASPKQAKAEVFPADDISIDEIARMLDELSANGLIKLYRVDGVEYFYVTGWKHQKIDRPQTPKYPNPLDDHSPNVRSVKEGKGRDSKEEKMPPAGAVGELEEILAAPDRRAYSEEFETLWRSYKPIAAKNATKVDASTAFQRLSKVDRAACQSGLEGYVDWLVAERRKRPETPAKHLATFIHKRGWEPFLEDAKQAETQAMVWLAIDDPGYIIANQRREEETGKRAPTIEREGKRGWYFPATYLEARTAA